MLSYDASESSCGALGALVPRAGYESSGLSRGPYRCSEEVAKADDEWDYPQYDGSCGADVGAIENVLLGDCKTGYVEMYVLGQRNADKLVLVMITHLPRVNQQ